jgi:hypothetical protein
LASTTTSSVSFFGFGSVLRLGDADFICSSKALSLCRFRFFPFDRLLLFFELVVIVTKSPKFKLPDEPRP